jgi:N-acetylmuramoyl-L-alanine amidase
MEKFTYPFQRPLRSIACIVLVSFVALAFTTASAAATPGYQSVRLYGVDYVDAQDFGRRFGLTGSWTAPQKSMRLKNATTTFDFSVHSVDSSLNGIRLFLAAPVVLRKGKLYLGKGDVEELLGPILSRNAGEPRSIIKTIVIDAGHGGSDPGNRNSRLKLNEKTFTLDVARRLERLLKSQGFKVVMTRKSDRAVDLDRRAEIANKARADLFISIHFNAFSRSTVAGAETYVMTPRNQRSSPQAERDDQMVRTKYPANEHDRWNSLLGYQIHRALVTGLDAADRGFKRFRYSVLRSVDCPAVLVEAAFLSNDAEGRRVATPAYRQRIAESIARGVQQHAVLRQRAKPRKG